MRKTGANKAQGAHFEAMFAARCGAYGIKAIKQPLAFKYLAGGKICPIVANLDFALLRRDGRVAYVDTKHFDHAFFTYAQLTKHQVARALQYDHYNVPAGFVVCFARADTVSYFCGSLIVHKGPRTRFTPCMGVPLGRPYVFDPRLIFQSHGL